MRILQVIHDFLPHHAAGAELYCFYLSRELARKHDVCLLFTEVDHTKPQYHHRQSSYLGLPYYEVVHNHVYRNFEDTYADPNMDRVFSQILDEVRPDVVHLQHLLNHSINYIEIARRRGIHVVFTLHDYWLSCPNGGQRIRPDLEVCETIELEHCGNCVRKFGGSGYLASRVASTLEGFRARRSGVREPPGSTQQRLAPAKRLYRAMERLLPRDRPAVREAQVARRLERIRAACREVDLFVAPSPFLRDRMIEFGLPEERIVLSDYGIATEELQSFRRRSSPRLRFGYVGTLVPHKGVHVLLEAFARLRERVPGADLELRVHGNPAWYPDYVKRLRSLAVPGVEFLGPFENRDALQIYANLDVLVVPSIWWENAPITIHEAIFTGTPVIASDFGGMADFVRHGENGLLFQVGDPEDLALQMQELVRNPDRIAALTRPVVPVKPIAEDAAEMERCYQGLLDGSPTSGVASATAG